MHKTASNCHASVLRASSTCQKHVEMGPMYLNELQEKNVAVSALKKKTRGMLPWI